MTVLVKNNQGQWENQNLVYTNISADISSVDLTLTGTTGTVIPADSRVSYAADGIVFRLNSDATINNFGTATVSARADVPGQSVDALQLTTILDPVTGWSSVTNPSASVEGDTSLIKKINRLYTKVDSNTWKEAFIQGHIKVTSAEVGVFGGLDIDIEIVYTGPEFFSQYKVEFDRRVSWSDNQGFYKHASYDTVYFPMTYPSTTINYTIPHYNLTGTEFDVGMVVFIYPHHSLSKHSNPKLAFSNRRVDEIVISRTRLGPEYFYPTDPTIWPDGLYQPS